MSRNSHKGLKKEYVDGVCRVLGAYKCLHLYLVQYCTCY